MLSREGDPFTGKDKPLRREQKLVIGLIFCGMGLVGSLGIDMVATLVKNLVAGS